jgi:hypothetical protein
MLPIGVKPRGPRQAALSQAYSQTYTAVHRRLRKWMGPASNYRCARCGEPASDWSYDGSDPKPLTAQVHDREVEYSSDLTRYRTLCRSCHTSIDRYGAIS